MVVHCFHCVLVSLCIDRYPSRHSVAFSSSTSIYGSLHRCCCFQVSGAAEYSSVLYRVRSLIQEASRSDEFLSRTPLSIILVS